MRGLSMIYPCLSIVYPLFIYDLSMVYPWFIYGLSMVYPWFMVDITMDITMDYRAGSFSSLFKWFWRSSQSGKV
jgi:hypothetical protein